MTARMYKQILWAIRVLAVVFVIGGVGWLVKHDLALSGEFEISHGYDGPSAFFSEWVPKQRTTGKNDVVQIQNEPVYTTISYPRPFEEVTLDVRFTNPDQIFAQFGPLVNTTKGYEHDALYHPRLQPLFTSDEWERTDENLFQRDSVDDQYVSTEQFFDTPPEQERTAYYGTNWQTPYVPQPAPNKPDAAIELPLRGAHDLYVAPGKETLSVSVSWQDLNEQEGADEVTVGLYDWHGEFIQNMPLPDDSNSSADEVLSDQREETLTFERLESDQVYELKLETSDDIIFHRISVDTPHLVFNGYLRLAGGPSYTDQFGEPQTSGEKFFTSARSWQAETLALTTTQSLRMVGDTVNLEEAYKPVQYQLEKKRAFPLESGYPVYFEKGNVTIRGEGVFALSQDAYFSPRPWHIDPSADLGVLGIDYVFTDYQAPARDGDAYTQQVHVDLSRVFAPEKALRFQLSAPDMTKGQYVGIKVISARFRSEPVTLSNAVEKAKRFLDRNF